MKVLTFPKLLTSGLKTYEVTVIETATVVRTYTKRIEAFSERDAEEIANGQTVDENDLRDNDWDEEESDEDWECEVESVKLVDSNRNNR